MRFVIIPLLLGFIDWTYGAKCELAVRGQITLKNPPVFFTVDKNTWSLAVPSIRTEFNSYIDLSDKTIGIACPGDKNELIIEGKSYGPRATGTCSSEAGVVKFTVNGVAVDNVNKLHCKLKASAEEEVTNKKCNKDGTELNLGFNVEKRMYNMITVCHRINDGTTYYSKHVISGKQFPLRKFKDKAAERPNFHAHNRQLYRGFAPFLPYKEKNQQKHLESSLGLQSLDNIFDKKKDKFFSKGHLAPNADFPLDTWKDITFLYVNTQPQWQLINGGNWNEFEAATRNLASGKGIDLEVITGTSGVLEPVVGDHHGKPLYLGDKRTHPVPATFWKIVRNTNTNECIGFVSNNFLLDKEPKPICKNICPESGWPKVKKTLTEGFIYCCSYQEIKKALSDVPETSCKGGVLSNK